MCNGCTLIHGWYGSCCGCGDCGKFKYGYWPQTPFSGTLTDRQGKAKADPNRDNNEKGKGKIYTIQNNTGKGIDKTYKSKGKGYNLATYTCIDVMDRKMADDWEEEFHAVVHAEFDKLVQDDTGKGSNDTGRLKGNNDMGTLKGNNDMGSNDTGKGNNDKGLLKGNNDKGSLKGTGKGKYDKGSLKGNTDKGSLKGNNDKGGDDWEQELYRFRAVEFERKLKGKGKDDDDRWLAPWTQQAQQQEVRR